MSSCTRSTRVGMQRQHRPPRHRPGLHLLGWSLHQMAQALSCPAQLAENRWEWPLHPSAPKTAHGPPQMWYSPPAEACVRVSIWLSRAGKLPSRKGSLRPESGLRRTHRAAKKQHCVVSFCVFRLLPAVLRDHSWQDVGAYGAQGSELLHCCSIALRLSQDSKQQEEGTMGSHRSVLLASRYSCPSLGQHCPVAGKWSKELRTHRPKKATFMCRRASTSLMPWTLAR